MTDEEKNFIKKINIDKAINKTKFTIILIVVSILTYVIPIFLRVLDFGIFFEIISLIFLIISRNYMLKYDEVKAKKYIICSLIPIGWLLIYDFIIFITSMKNLVDVIFLGYNYYWMEILLLLYMMMLLLINKNLSKANDPIKYKESTDWFYESYDIDKKEEDNNMQ